MHAKIDSETCIGCELCPETCPAVFEMEGDVAIVKADPVPAGEEDATREAADACPVDAITVTE